MKKVIITGISGGLGYETAKILLSKGITVVGIGRNKTNLNIPHIFADFLKEDDIGNAISEIKEKYNDFDVFINCAGIMSLEKLENIRYKSVEDVYKINVFAPIMLVSGLADIIKKMKLIL